MGRLAIKPLFAGLAILCALILVIPCLFAQTTKATFTGSASCQSCHAKEFKGWKETRMANVVRDPKTHPDAVLGDFSKPDPARTFGLGDVAFVYGSRWKQRYFTKRILQHEIDHLKGTLYLDRMWSRSFSSLDQYNRHWKSKSSSELAQQFRSAQ